MANNRTASRVFNWRNLVRAAEGPDRMVEVYRFKGRSFFERQGRPGRSLGSPEPEPEKASSNS